VAITVRHLGRAHYRTVEAARQRFTSTRSPQAIDELWLVEHPPVFTLGINASREHLLAPPSAAANAAPAGAGPPDALGGIEVVQTDRGGQVTYHGPGQLVAYPLVDLKRLGIGVRDFVHRIEETIIQVLARYGVSGERIEGAPGIYVGGDKIASLGLRVRRGCTFHGLAFNIEMDLEPFQRINPCGYQGLRVIRLSDLVELEFNAVENHLIEEFVKQLGYSDVAEKQESPR
jgi:lipoyl(octanoyl) transferase